MIGLPLIMSNTKYEQFLDAIETGILARGRDYILDGKTPVVVKDILEWGRWYETAERRVAQSQHSSGVRVSTVFLGLNHAWGDGPPELFETMSFGGDWDGDLIARYATWDEAEAGHAAAVDELGLTDGEWAHWKPDDQEAEARNCRAIPK